MCDIRRLCDVHTAIPFVNFRSKKQEYSNPSPSFFQRCNRDDEMQEWDSRYNGIASTLTYLELQRKKP